MCSTMILFYFKYTSLEMHNKSDANIVRHPNDNYELYRIYCTMQKKRHFTKRIITKLHKSALF